MSATNQKEYSFLKFVQFKEMVAWDYYTLAVRSEIKAHFPLVKLGDVLKQRKGFITIDDEKTYKRCRVQLYGNGVVLRDEVLGAVIKTKKQQLCKPEDFLVAEIDAKFGGYGIVPAELENAVVSSHYFLFEIDKTKLRPDFLGLVVKLQQFSKQVKATGSTNYAAVRPFHVLGYQIPLPSLLEQEALVVAYQSKLAAAEAKEYAAAHVEEEIEDYFLEQLDLPRFESKVAVKGLQFVRFAGLDKWGVDYALREQQNQQKYLSRPLKLLCKVSSGGTPSRSQKKYFGGDIPWIKTGELNNNLLYETEESITTLGLQNSSAKLYPIGSVVMAMYGATIGKTAKLAVPASTNQACAVFFDFKKELQPDFLWWFLQVRANYFKGQAYGSAQPNISAGLLAATQIPIPPIETQKEIVVHCFSLRAKQQSNKSEAVQLKRQAVEEFETAIFQS